MTHKLDFIPAETAHLSAMLRWFNNEDDIRQWGGPDVRYPCDLSSLAADAKLDSLDSFCLFNNEAELLAFGQCYERLGHCHLCRLAVSPAHRGKGLICELMTQLIGYGTKQFSVSPSSLFVFASNARAISAYKKYGFRATEYPEKMPFKDCLYMIYDTANSQSLNLGSK